MENTQDNN